MLLCTPPLIKFQLKRSCAITALAFSCLYSYSALATSFIVDKDHDWTGGKTLIFIEDDIKDLSNHSFKIDGTGIDWGKNLFETTKLVFNDQSTLSENLSFEHNKIEILNTQDQSLKYVEILESTPLKNAYISDNHIKIDKVSAQVIRPIFITEEVYPKRLGSENIKIEKNFIDVLGSSASSSTSLIVISAGSGEIFDNEFFVSNGTHKTITGVSATNLYVTSSGQVTQSGSLKIHHNKLKIQDTTFRSASTISVTRAPYGEIQNNELELSGTNTFNPDDSKNNYILGVVATGNNSLSADKTSPNADIDGTKVTITGKLIINENGNQGADIGGAKSVTGSVSGNELKLENLDIEIAENLALRIYGGYSGQDTYSMPKVGARAFENKVLFKGIHEDWSSRKYNPIISGGYSEIQDADGNEVELSESVLLFNTDKAGPSISGGYAAENSTNNKVQLNQNSSVVGNIVGSVSEQGGELSSTVTISDSSVEGDISLFEIGTWDASSYKTKTPSDETIGQNSTLEIIGINSDLSKANLFVTKTAGIQTSNNVLKIDGWQGEIGSLGTVTDDGVAVGFDHLAIHGLEWKNGSVLIKSLANPEQGEYTVFNQSAIDDTSLVFTSAPTLNANEQITILQADNGITYVGFDSTVKQKNVKANAGTATEFDGTINYEDDRVTYAVEKIERAQQTTVLGDSRIAAAAFVNQSNDLLAHVFSTFMHDQKYGLATFASAEGNRSQYDLDSSLKINGWNFMAGIRYKDRLSVGDWTSAIFFENGEGNYRTWNEHLGHTFKTNGELTYNGAGIATRLMTDSGFYSEGSVHLGQLKIEMNNALLDTAGNNWDFDSRSMYYGAHLGLGWLMPISSTLDFDLSGKYFYARTTSDTFRVNDEKYCFSNIDSHRLQLEGKLNYTENNVTLYSGLGVEYEFDGQSSMKAASTPKFVSDINGFTAIADLGMRISPSVNSPWLFQANVRGWEGERDGVSGTATIEYQF